MLSIWWFVVAVTAAILLTAWVTFTATRLDRLHARIDAAQAALDAQLVRRAAALQRVADVLGPQLGPDRSQRIELAAQAALAAPLAAREQAENEVGRLANELADGQADPAQSTDPVLHEVAESAFRVIIARRFYNDAVRDTRTLRGGRMPRLLHLAGHRAMPEFFDIDDATRWSLTPPQITPGGSS